MSALDLPALQNKRSPMQRLLRPNSLAVFGGRVAAEVVRQSQRLGFAGEIWPVHPTLETVLGVPCYPSVADLPAAPDASFIAVNRHATVDIVGQLAARGGGGVIAYASGFAEVGREGAALQAQLVQAAGDMALLGPNCYGMLNYLDGAAPWPDQHGGKRVSRGVAILTQSGNIGLNLTMQLRGLPLACLITVGNKAGVSIETIVETLLQDERITAIGLHIEGLDDIPAFSRVAIKALAQKMPLVALKSGSSSLGAQITMSHTSSLAGPDALYSALFARLGVARVFDPVGLIETLKLLHVRGALAGSRFIAASCSGGEASLVADLAQERELDMPPLPAQAYQRLYAALGDKVNVANPLDYHTYIWGDLAAQTECFSGLMDCAFDAHVLVLDFPRADSCDASSWTTTADAFVAAHQQHSGGCNIIVASLPESMSEAVAERLIAQGLVPMQGLPDCLDAIAHAAMIGRAQKNQLQLQALPNLRPRACGPAQLLDEAQSKQALAAFGLRTPQGLVVPSAKAGELATSEAAELAAEVAAQLGFPVVVKAVSDQLAHKTEAGAVRLNLQSAAQVREAVVSMYHLSDQFLVEQMAVGTLAEFIVGVQSDPQFGLSLTLGAGGIFVELLQDSVTLLLPVSRDDVLTALQSLKLWPLVTGYRGRAEGDVAALLDAVTAIAAYAEAHSDHLIELDVNPLLVLPRGAGVFAVDALIRLKTAATK